MEFGNSNKYMPTIADTNNNPGNLKDPSTGKFRTFSSPEEGYAALLNDFQVKIDGKSKTGLNAKSTLYDWAQKYAPSTDNNDPGQYTANLANSLGIRPDTTLGELQPHLGDLVQAVARNEGYTAAKGFSKKISIASPIQEDPLSRQEAVRQENKTPGILGSVSRFLGLDAFGQGMGKALFQFTDEYRNLQKMLDSGLITPQQFEDISTGGLTNKEVLASAGQTALNIATAGIGSGEAAVARGATGKLISSTAGKFSPLGKAIAGNITSSYVAPTAGRVLAGNLLGSTATGAGLGAATSGLQAYGEGEDVAGITKSSLLGGAFGGVLGLAGGAVSQALGSFLEKVPPALQNQAFKSPLSETKKVITGKADDFGQQLLDHGFIGTNKQALARAEQGLQMNETALQDTISGMTGKIKRTELKPYFQDFINKYQNTPGMSDDVKIVQKVIKEIKPEMTLSEANVVKRNIYNELGNPGYKFDASLSTKRKAMKDLARGIKDLIEKKTGSTGKANSVVNHFNRELAFYGKLRDRAITNMAKAQNAPSMGIKDIATFGIGHVVKGPILGTGLEVARKSYGTTIGKTAIATGLNKLDKIGKTRAGVVSKNIVKTAGRIAGQGIVNQ